MARYIDADKLIEHIKDLPTWREVLGRGWLATKYPDGTFDCEDVIISIVNAPTADVEEVRHGEWIDDGDCFHCLVCNKTYNLGSLQTIYDVKRCWKYCANCGAKMDGGKAE